MNSGWFQQENLKELDRELNSSRKYNMKICYTYFKKPADVSCIAVY